MTSPSCGFSLTVSGNDDAAFRLVLTLDTADDDTVVQWTEFHGGFARGLTCDAGQARLPWHSARVLER